MGIISKAAKAAKDRAKKEAERQARRRATDPTLPADSDPEMGADVLREGQVVKRGEGKTDLLSAKERKLRDDFFDLKPRDRNAERAKGRESKFAPYFAAQRRLDRQVRKADDFVPNDPSLRVQKTTTDSPSNTVMIDGKRYKRGDTKDVEQARALARVKEKLLERPAAEGMKKGGLTRKQTNRKRKSTKRKNITASMSAARGGLMKTGHKDYRKGGMFYVGGTSAKVTPINKGKKK